MNLKPILIYSFSFLFSFLISAQEVQKSDSAVVKKPKKYSSIFVGADLFLPSISFLNDRQGGRGFVHYQYKERNALVFEAGYEKNSYDKINWLVDVNGFFVAAGINYFFLVDKEENNFNGFYVGARVGNANYQQEIKQYPIYGTKTSELIGVGSLEKANVNSTWFEGVFGARVDFIKRTLYADVSFRPKFHLFTTEQEGIKPLVIPGFGVNRNNLNFDLFFALVYQLDLKKNKKTTNK